MASENIITDVVKGKRGMKLEPIRVHFQNASLDPETTKDVGVGLYKDSLDDDYMAICKVNEILYKGTVQQAKNNELKSYLAIRNKRTTKIKLVEISHVSLKPDIQYPPSLNTLLIEDEEIDEEGNPVKLDRAKLNQGFVERFGLLRGQRIYKQAEQLTVKAEVVRVNLDNAAEKTTVEAVDLAPAKEESYDYLLPTRNPDATRGLDVYQMADIVTDDDMKNLTKLAEYCLDVDSAEIDSWQKESQYSSIFVHRLLQLRRPNKMGRDEQVLMISALVYAELLVKLVHLKAHAFKRKDPLPGDFPDAVRRRVLERFTTFHSGVRSFSQVDRERAICHLMILLFLVSDCFVDLKLLSDSLHMPIDKLVPLVSVVGAHHVSNKASGVTTATLTVPLSGPPKRAFSGKKKGGR